jgi:cyclic pyranopterin phosphate synthase
MSETLSHFDEQGRGRMVDVSSKADSHRIAVARASIEMKATTVELIRNRELSKGDVIEVARIAAIMAVKQTPNLIPMCHSIHVDSVDLEFKFSSPTHLLIEATVGATDRTGVEMEALTSVSVAALTVYDMCKSADREMTIRDVQLVRKTGGKSGDFERETSS